MIETRRLKNVVIFIQEMLFLFIINIKRVFFDSLIKSTVYLLLFR